MEVVISRSSKKDKRLKAQFENKAVHFGSKHGSTFIDHKNTRVKAAWEARHRPREDWSDLETAGALAKHVLWNKPSLRASTKDLNHKQKKYSFVLKR